MIQDKIPNFSFQTYYVSNEICSCPLISEILKFNKKIKNIEILKDINNMSISMKYGRRVLINAKNIDFNKSNYNDFLEVVDYDPLKKILLIIGSKEPCIETPIHWLIHHAREEVKAIIEFNNEQLIEQINKELPITERRYQKGTLEQAKEILFKLRDSKVVIIKNQGVIFVGDSIKDIEDSVMNTFEELK
jgi:hypothetical protein